MNISVLGTGMVGRALAARLVELGHQVRMGTRDPEATLARSEADGMGNAPFADWHAQNPGVELVPFGQAGQGADFILNATNAQGSLAALEEVGADQLNGKILVDIANPLDFSQGFPPTLFVSNSDSLGEQIQRAFPQVKVVKTLNTVNAHIMAYPRELAGGQHTVFLSGNDADAKQAVAGLLRSFGWEDILDLGDISTARGPEMYLPLWLRLWGSVGSGLINVRVVRPGS